MVIADPENENHTTAVIIIKAFTTSPVRQIARFPPHPEISSPQKGLPLRPHLRNKTIRPAGRAKFPRGLLRTLRVLYRSFAPSDPQEQGQNLLVQSKRSPRGIFPSQPVIFVKVQQLVIKVNAEALIRLLSLVLLYDKKFPGGLSWIINGIAV
jgi:hypothetical protein